MTCYLRSDQSGNVADTADDQKMIFDGCEVDNSEGLNDRSSSLEEVVNQSPQFLEIGSDIGQEKITRSTKHPANEADTNLISRSVNHELPLCTGEVVDETLICSEPIEESDTDPEELSQYIRRSTHLDQIDSTIGNSKFKNLKIPSTYTQSCSIDQSTRQIHYVVGQFTPEDHVDIDPETDPLATNQNSSSENIIDTLVNVDQILSEIESNTVDELVTKTRSTAGKLALQESEIDRDSDSEVFDTADVFDEISIERDIDSSSDGESAEQDPTSSHFQTRHPPKQRFKCEKCGWNFATKTGLLRHNKKLPSCQTAQGKFKCKKCDYRGRFIHNLKYHIKAVHDHRTYVCNICGKTCAHQMSLQKHRQRCYPGKNLISRTSRFGRRRNPGTRPGEYICNYCQKCFGFKIFLKRHILNHIHNYKCDQCDRLFHTESGLNLHKKAHSPNYFLKCDKCDFTGKIRKSINDHMLIEHGIEGSVICDTCGESFKCKVDLNQHCRSVHCAKTYYKLESVEYICHYCQKSFRFKISLRKHILNHFSNYKCDQCNQLFLTEPGLNRHKKAHSPNYFLKCEKCDFTAKIRKSVNDHMLIEHGIEGSVICNTCGESFKCKLTLNKHRRSAHYPAADDKSSPFVCDYNETCNERFLNWSNLLRHLKDVHERPTEQFTCEICDQTCQTEAQLQAHFRTHLGENPFGCDYCDLTFETKQNLEYHLQYHPSAGQPQFVCDYCQQEFASKLNLREHIVSAHTPEFKCDKCDKRYNNEAELRSHQSTHIVAKVVRSKKYCCEICGQQCVSSFNMELHLLTHGYRYDCQFCQNSFDCKKDLRTHLRVHLPQPTQAKQYSCEICNYKFFNFTKLADHFRTHTGEKPFACEKCSRRFDSSQSLSSHHCVALSHGPVVQPRIIDIIDLD